MAFSNFIFEKSMESGRKDWKKAKFSNAEKHYDRALKEAQQPGAPPEALSLILLVSGVLYRDWANSGAPAKFPEAERRYLRLLQLRQAIGGAKDPEALHTMRLLGTMYLDWGGAGAKEKLASAETWLRKWLTSAGDTSPEAAEVLYVLAQVYGTQGKIADAEASLKKALKINDRIDGGNNLGSATIHHELGNLYWALKRHAPATEHLQRSISIKERLGGAGHPYLEPSLAALAAVYRDMGDQTKSEAALARASAIGKSRSR